MKGWVLAARTGRCEGRGALPLTDDGRTERSEEATG